MQYGQAASRTRVLCRALAFFLAFSATPVCRAILLNRTIDSKYGDSETGLTPTYSVANTTAWNDETCAGCFIQPDPSKAFDHTWSSATYHPSNVNVSLTLQFTGVAVWVFFILSNANSHGPGTTTSTQCNFTLDGQHAGSFSYDSDMTRTDMVYNATVFSTTNLANTSHQLIVSVNDYPNSTFLNFDYAVYTFDNGIESTTTTTASSQSPSPSTSSTSSSSQNASAQPSTGNTGIIVGCVLGGLAVLIVIAVFVVRRLRRPRTVQSDTAAGAILDLDDAPRGPSAGPPRWHHPSASLTSLREDINRPSHYRGPSASDRHIPLLASPPGRDVYSEDSSRAKIREMRQMDIDARLRSAQQEMRNLTASQSPPSSNGTSSGSGQSRSEREIHSLRDQVQQLRSRIDFLQEQRQTEWANGLTDEQPPAYTRTAT